MLCSVRTDWLDKGDTHWGLHWSHSEDTGTNFQTFTPTPRAWRRREGHLSGVCINFPLWHHWLCLLKLFSHHPSVRFIHHTTSIFQTINRKKCQERWDHSRQSYFMFTTSPGDKALITGWVWSVISQAAANCPGSFWHSQWPAGQQGLASRSGRKVLIDSHQEPSDQEDGTSQGSLQETGSRWADTDRKTTTWADHPFNFWIVK